jgi:hypothetical protein
MGYRDFPQDERPKAKTRIRGPQALARLEEIELEQARRRIVQIEGLLADLARSEDALQREIEIEENRVRIRPLGGYSSFVEAAFTRRRNLRRSAQELRRTLDDLRAYVAAVELTPAD